jgi:hypothetical protein
MTTDVGHGRRRRGRRAGAKRRTVRAAIAAGTLAAASFPLWPSAAGASAYDEYNSERATIRGPLGGDCAVTVTSFRAGEHVEASTTLDYDASPDCVGRGYYVATNLSYIPGEATASRPSRVAGR